MEYQLERHDRFNFEAKTDYSLDLERRYNRYLLSFYFFIPKSLKISKNVYSKADFYTDMFSYIRFKIPRFTFEELLDEGNLRSPLTTVGKLLADSSGSVIGPHETRRLIYELRLLGTVLKALLKTEAFHVARSMKQSSIEDLDRLMKEIETVDGRILGFSDVLTSERASRELRETFLFAADFTSLNMQTCLTSVLKVCGKTCGKAAKERAKRLIAMIEAHQKRRSARGSPLFRKVGSSNEEFTYWESILKKYFQGVLYLDILDRNPQQNALHIFYAFAAGIAMFLSLVLGLWIAGIFTDQQSIGFIAALVVAYMVKDRVKDLMREYSNRIIRKFLPDRRFAILDSLTSSPIGTMKDSVRFVRPEDVPEEILVRRTKTNQTLIETQGKPEEVLVYEKEVSLDTKRIGRIHVRHRDISDIMRFNVKRLIQYADDPYHIQEVWHGPSRKIKKVKCAKVYHLNLVMRMEALHDNKGDRIHFKRVRAILNQKGLLEVVEIVE